MQIGWTLIKDFEKNSLPLWLASLVAGLPCGSAGKESACNAGDLGLTLGLGRCPGEGNGNPLQYSWLKNSRDRGVWWATVLGVAKELDVT